MPEWLPRLGHGAHNVLRFAAFCAVIALIAATGLGVIARYFRIGGVSWSYELSAMTFLWVIALGAVIAEILGENVSIDGTNVDRGRLFRGYHAMVLLGVAAALIWSGYFMLKRTAFMPTPVMRAPSWTIQSIIIVMGVCLAIVALSRLVRLFK